MAHGRFAFAPESSRGVFLITWTPSCILGLRRTEASSAQYHSQPPNSVSWSAALRSKRIHSSPCVRDSEVEIGGLLHIRTTLRRGPDFGDTYENEIQSHRHPNHRTLRG